MEVKQNKNGEKMKKLLLLSIALLTVATAQTKPAAGLNRITSMRNSNQMILGGKGAGVLNSQRPQKTYFVPGEVITRTAPASTPGSLEYSRPITYFATPKNSIELTQFNPSRNMGGNNYQYKIKVSKHVKPGTTIKIYQKIQGARRYKEAPLFKTRLYRTITVVSKSFQERMIKKQNHLKGHSTIYGRNSRTGNWRTKNIWDRKLMGPARDIKGNVIYPKGYTSKIPNRRANRRIQMQDKSNDGQVRPSGNLHREPHSLIEADSSAPWNWMQSSNNKTDSSTLAPWR